MFSARFGVIDSGHWIEEQTEAEMPYPPRCGSLGGCTVPACLDSMSIGAWGGESQLFYGNRIFTGTLKKGVQTWDSDALWGL